MAGAYSVVFLVAGLSLVLAVHVVVVVWALKWGLRARNSRVGEHTEEAGCGGGAAGLSAEEVEGLPCHEFEGAGGECVVCLEAFRGGDRCRALPGCDHGFHAECVDSWLRKSRRCPICRAEVVVVGHGKNAGAVAEAAALEIVTER